MKSNLGWMVLVGCLLPSIAFAITRDAAIEYALKKSEASAIARQNYAIKRAGGDQAVAFTRPQTILDATYLEMGTNAPKIPKIEIPGGELDFGKYLDPPDRDFSAQLSLSQTLFAGGRIWDSLRLRDNFYKQAETQMESDWRDIRKQVKTAFDSVLYQRAALEILMDRVHQRQNELEDAQDLKAVGVVTSLDVRQAKLNLNFALDALKAGEATAKETLINFNTVLGADKSDAFVPEGFLKDVPDLQKIVAELEGVLKQQSFLDLTLLKQQVRGAELSYDIAHGEYYPEVSLISSGKSNGEKLNDTDESWNIGLQMSWSIFDGGLTRSKQASALAALKKGKEGLKKMKKELTAAVATIKIDGQTLIERTQLQKEALELSHQNYDDARGHYRAGTITLTRLGEFNLSYAEARFNLLRLYFLQRELISKSEALLGR